METPWPREALAAGIGGKSHRLCASAYAAVLQMGPCLTHRASPSVCPAHSKDERARLIRVSVLNQGNKSLI